MTTIEQSLAKVDTYISRIDKAQAAVSNLESEIADNAAKELQVLDATELSTEQKTAKLLELRALSDVLKKNLQNLRVSLRAVEDEGIVSAQDTYFLICQYRDTIREQAFKAAVDELNKLLVLQRGEAEHFAIRTRAVSKIDSVESIGFSKAEHRRPEMLVNLPRLKPVFYS